MIFLVYKEQVSKHWCIWKDRICAYAHLKCPVKECKGINLSSVVFTSVEAAMWLGQRVSVPHTHHHVAQPQRVVQPLQFLVLPVPLHQPLRHLAVLPFILIHHLKETRFYTFLYILLNLYVSAF